MSTTEFPQIPNRAGYVFARFYRQEDAIQGPIQVSEDYDERDKSPLLLESEKLVGREATGEEQKDSVSAFVQKHGFDVTRQFDGDAWAKAVAKALAERQVILKASRDRLFEEFAHINKKTHCWQLALSYIKMRPDYRRIDWESYFPGVKHLKLLLQLDQATLNEIEAEFRVMVSILVAPEDTEKNDEDLSTAG